MDQGSVKAARGAETGQDEEDEADDEGEGWKACDWTIRVFGGENNPISTLEPKYPENRKTSLHSTAPIAP